MATETRDFDFQPRDFERVRRLIYARVGIALNESKEQMVYSRLARRLRQLGLERFSDYLDLLDDATSAEWELFTNALTTNLTSFFREAHHFDILARSVYNMPRPINIWCTASSTGEEPYSIAMTVMDALGSASPPASIIASDIDTQVLQHAESGIYERDKVARLAPDQLKRFFLKGEGSKQGLVRVRRELREMVVFRQINLLANEWPIRGGLSAIFCRNVMIYFDKPTQRRILERFAPLLHPQGLLFVGHSEALHHAADLFSPVGRTVYRLKTGGRHATSV